VLLTSGLRLSVQFTYVARRPVKSCASVMDASVVAIARGRTALGGGRSYFVTPDKVGSCECC
jgi:hypothetical protein